MKYKIILLSILLVPLVVAPTLNNFTKPNHTLYPNLQYHTSNMQIHDFTNNNEMTYYYNSLGTTIKFSVNNTPVTLTVKEVYSDKEEEEYAIVEISARRSKTTYENLYVRKPVTINLFNEEIQLIAKSIIDGDNIEYLTIKGIKEIEEIEDTPLMLKKEPIKVVNNIKIPNEVKPSKQIELPKVKQTSYEVITMLSLSLIILTFILFNIFNKEEIK